MQTYFSEGLMYLIIMRESGDNFDNVEEFC